MRATINTDASYSHKHGVGAFAFWIVCDGGVRYFNAGPLKGYVESPSAAELMCIVKALKYLQDLQARGMIRPVEIVHINTDSLNSIHILQDDQKAIKKYALDKGQYKTTFDTWLKIKRYNWTIKAAHVRSHVSTSTARQYVNEWCDKNAKKFIQILITERETALIQTENGS